jgi:uncharacterized protein (DUF4415 family)
MRQDLIRPTPDEDEAIQRGIANDLDSPELTGGDFKRMRPLRDVDPGLHAALTQQGPQLQPARTRVSLRLDRDLLDALRAPGRGWQDRANAALRKAVLGE